MAGIGYYGDVNIIKICRQLVTPCRLKHRVAGAPEYPRRYFQRRCLDRRLQHLPDLDIVETNIPIETTLKISGHHEVINPHLKIIIESMRVMRPMREEMLEINPARIAVITDQVSREGFLVERLVPDFLQMVGLGPSTSNTRVRAIEEQQTVHPLRPTPRKGLGGIGSGIVTDNADMFQTKTVQEVSKILGQNIRASGRDVFWITEPSFAEFA